MHMGSSNSGKLGKKAPRLRGWWGDCMVYDKDGNLIRVIPANQPSKPKRRRRR